MSGHVQWTAQRQLTSDPGLASSGVLVSLWAGSGDASCGSASVCACVCVQQIASGLSVWILLQDNGLL